MKTNKKVSLVEVIFRVALALLIDLPLVGVVIILWILATILSLAWAIVAKLFFLVADFVNSHYDGKVITITRRGVPKWL